MTRLTEAKVKARLRREFAAHDKAVAQAALRSAKIKALLPILSRLQGVTFIREEAARKQVFANIEEEETDDKRRRCG